MSKSQAKAQPEKTPATDKPETVTEKVSSGKEGTLKDLLRDIRIEQEHLIDAGAEVVSLNLSPTIRFIIYKGEHLNNMALFVKDELVGLSRYNSASENIFPVFAAAMLRLFVQSNEQEMGQLSALADRVAFVLPTLVSFYPVTLDIAFTTTAGDHGYVVLTKDAKVIAGNLQEPAVQEHMNKFAFMFNRLVHVAEQQKDRS